MTELKLNGIKFKLYAPVGLFFEVYDRFGYGDILEVTGCLDNTAEGWAALCWLISRMTDYAKMLARHMGDELPPTVSEEALALEASNWDVPKMREAALAALTEAMRHNESPDGTVDLTLARIRENEEKKTADGA